MTLVINGKTYPLWSQFVESRADWIGGTLQDFGDAHMQGDSKTTITDIELVENGSESAFFRVCGETFSCGFDVRYGGVVGGEEGWATFSGYQGHKWRIKKPNKEILH